jgi:hypothetical protein
LTTRELPPMGALPSLPDIRDRLFAPYAPLAIPRAVDLRSQGPLIWDQVWGSCVAHGILRGVAHAQRRQGEPVLSASPLFTYWTGRELEGWTQEDSGLYVRDGAKAVAKYGVAPYDTFTNNHGYADRPPAKAFDAALREKVITYHRVLYPDQIHLALQSGFPVVFGMSLYESFLGIGSDGKVPVPSPSEQLIGGHSMCVEGYEPFIDSFIVPNSWGTSFGDHGYLYMPAQMFDFVTGPLFNDLWVIDLTDKE